MKKLGPRYLWSLSLAVPAAVLATSACSDGVAPPGSTGGFSNTATGGSFSTTTGGTGTGMGTGGTTSTTTGGASSGTTGGASSGTTGGASSGTTGGTSTAGTTSATGGDGTAGGSSTGGAPPMKLCAKKTTLTVPLMTNFDSYDGKAALDMWGFPFNGAPTDPTVLYAGPYAYNDMTGTPFTGMVGGANDSMYAISISNPMATGWGGGVGFWMGCVNASAYAGVSFYARGMAVPTGKISVALTMEETSAPNATDPAGGGTCTAGTMCKSPQVEVAVTADWTLIKIPWSMFAPGAGSSGVADIAPTGDGIAGIAFQVGMLYVESPAGSGTYVPTPGPYDLQLDDLGFY